MDERQIDLDRDLTAALEHQPDIRIPTDFAARVAAQAAAQPLPKARHSTSYGQAFTIAAAALLLFAMFLVAPWTQPAFSSIAFDVELAMLAQLVLIGWWVAARPRA